MKKRYGPWLRDEKLFKKKQSGQFLEDDPKLSDERSLEKPTNFKRWSALYSKMKSERQYRKPKSKVDPEDKPIDYDRSDCSESSDFD